jgi:Mrp family chromosome partitioning ATPase
LESFRNMAYSFLASSASEGRTVLFTGIGAAGSSSISAAQFAVALAQAGTRVVLVDAERTRQIISTGFGVTDKKGVSNAFYDGSDPTTMLIETKYKNLTVLPLGTVPETLVTNGGPDQVESLLASLRQVSDMIVISVAPTDLVADAAAFASRVDEVCLSVSARSNEYGSVPTAYDILDKAGAKAIKLILTDASKGGEPFTSPTSIQRAV